LAALTKENVLLPLYRSARPAIVVCYCECPVETTRGKSYCCDELNDSGEKGRKLADGVKARDLCRTRLGTARRGSAPIFMSARSFQAAGMLRELVSCGIVN